jgi:precorrin-4 methylase
LAYLGSKLAIAPRPVKSVPWLPATTPVAVVLCASLPDQRQAVTTLGDLHATIVREQRERLAVPP